MSRRKVKITDRLLAMLLSVMMVVSMLPRTVFPVMAATEEETGSFTLTVTDGTTPIEGVVVTLSSDTGEWSEDLETTTNGNGIASFSTVDISKALVDGTGSITYTAKFAGYFTKTDVINITTEDLAINTDIQLVRGTDENSFKVTIEDKESHELLKGAEVVIIAKEDEGWSLNLVGITDVNGVAWFDMSALTTAIPNGGEPNITYTVSCAGYETATDSIAATTVTTTGNLDVEMDKMPEDTFDITVKDVDSQAALKDVEIVLSAKEAENWTLNLSATTLENGVASFSKSEIEQALTTNGLQGGTIKYIAKCNNYYTVTDEIVIGTIDTLADDEITMKAITEENSFKVVVKEGEDLIEGAEVVLSAKENTWSLNLVTTTDANGIAWFDKVAITNVLPSGGDANISYKVSYAGYKDATGDISKTALDSEYNVPISKVEVESFKVLVKDTEGIKAGAIVALSAKEGEEWTLNLITTTDENGVAWFTKEAIAGALPDNGNWTIVYTVTLAGYRTLTKEVIVSEDTLVQTVDVDIVKIVSNTLNVSITSGQATVKLNGNEQNSISVSNAVVNGEYVDVEIDPIEGYIKTLTINGANQDLTGINKGDAYTNTIKVDAETIIEVEIIKEYTVTVNGQAEHGTVKINGQTGSLTFDEGTSISVNVNANNGYQISSVSITGINDIEITDKYEFTREGIVLNSDIVVNVSYVKVYTITVNYNENGTVSIDRGETEGGSVVVNTGGDAVIEEGKTVTLVADPNDNFRVSEVWIDGEEDKSISGANYGTTDVYSKVLTPSKSFTVSVVFAPNRYEIASIASENGSIVVEKDLVDYNGNCKVWIKPIAGYSISNIQVNGADYEEDNNDEEKNDNVIVVADTNYRNGAILTLNNISSDKTINVTFDKISSISTNITDLFNYEEAVRIDNMTFIYEKVYGLDEHNDKYIKFSVAGMNIALFLKEDDDWPTYNDIWGDIVCKKSLKIEKIELSDKNSDKPWENWQPVEGVSAKNPLIIEIDNGGISSVITPSAKHSEQFYNTDFDVEISATDDYSGISKIEYFVTNSIINENAQNYDNIATELKSQSGELYTHGYQINDNVKKSLTVDAELNNTDYVSVWFKITDRAGNVKYDRTEYYKVNCTPPELGSVVINGEELIGAKPGYYNKAVTATVVIKDRVSSLNKDKTEVFSITAKDKEGKDIANAYEISDWSSNGDVHTTTIKFNKDAHYVLTINYVNEANKAMVNAENVNSVYSLTVDTQAPTGTITFDEETVWTQILETLTFGFFSDKEITATATINYDLSPTYDILYYMSDTTTLLTEEELKAIYDADNSSFTDEKITVSTEGKYIIYARLTDYAGNTRYISTEGTIIEDTDGEITVIPSEAANGNGFYNKDVILNVTVKDKLDDTDELYSGIKTIDYYVIKDGVESELINLYTFNEKSPKYEELTTDWTGNITIKANEYNSDNVKVVVVAEDNAGNKKINDECTLKINVDEVKATLTMDGVANKVIDEHGYFKVDKRTATITVIDRLSAFNSNIATDAVNITAVDKDGNEISNAYEISDWESKEGKHTATVTFNSNAIYTWSFDYTNKADNTLLANNFDTEDVQTPFSFTIDNVAPKGVVKVNDNAWDKLLNVLTFGYYDKVKAEVSAEASDNISPFIIEYYKTSNVNPMTESELEDVEFKSYAPFSVSGNEQFVVYVKISDYAGNCTYISSAGHVIDEAKSTITLTQSQTDALYNASDDVKVNVLVEDAEPYSGIKLVEYWIVNNGVKTQGEAIYTFDETNPTYDKLMKTWTGVITVDKSKNNSNDVEVYVRTVDNANNEETKSTKLAIDTVKPSISVKFDNGNDNNGNSYFDDKRVATVVITERAEQFDKNAATNGILINAVDAEGNKVNDAYTISGWTTSVNAENPDASTHTATITFAKDANYTWSISYTDKAGNVNSAVTTSVVNGTSVAPFDFTVDTVAPTGTLQALSAEGKKAEWNALRPNLTFGFVSKGKITVSGTFDDVTSESPYKIEYYKVKATAAKDGTTALTEKDLNAVKNWTSLITKQQTNEYGKYYSFGDVVASKDEQFVVYVKLTDLAGNVKYLGTNGLIVDHTAPSEETLAPEVTMTQKAPVNGVYKDDVSVEIKVVDPLIGGTYSGLESVTYKVLNMGKETQTGELFAFKIQDPKQSELVQTWTGKIVVDSELNNSNNVQVVVYATDKAGNQSSKTLTLKIDTTAPVIDIEYNNNNGETSYAGETLFKEDRVATIKVTERNFNGSKVVINVTNTDGSKPVLSNWTVFKNGTGNGDDTVYMATLTYNADGDYKFDIKYEDEAENVCTDIDYGNSLAPTEFTIDKTLPTIQVSYDNNNVSNGNYYNQDRTATVIVTEHNFDESRYVLTITATDNGVAAQIPTAGQWTSNGDVHRMTIPFTKDAHYTIDIEFTDKAGNIASDFAEQNFFIDKTNPTLSISGVTNESANNAGEVGLVITATDTNMDVFEPDIYAVIVTDDSYDTEHFNIGKRQNITNGIKYTVSNLDKDGMYKVECNLVDKAGNVYSEVLLYKSDDTSYTEQKTVGDVLLTFSVNREGSVYEVNDVTEKLIKDTYVQRISDDLAIVEVNADELVEYQVILNGKALTEDVDFTVVKEGGNGQWYKYTYLVNKSLFEADGEYELVISSKDRAFNSAFSDVKGRTITFVVDTTEPVVAVSGLESNGRYKVTEQAVTLVPTDDGGYISKVLVGYADKSGNIYQEIFSLSGEELIKALEEGQGKLSFVIKEGLDKDIKIMCWDSAFDSEGNANVYEKIYTGVSVSTSQIAMLWASDAIRNAIIISAVVVVVGIIAIIVIRKTRKNKR